MSRRIDDERRYNSDLIAELSDEIAARKEDATTLKNQISLLEKENERLADYIENLGRGFTYVSENGRELLVRMWNDEPWIFYKHPDGQWVSLQKCAIAEEWVLAKG